MAGPHFFLKSLRLEGYIEQDSLPRVDLDNFGLDTKVKTEELSKTNGGVEDGICSKENLVGGEVDQTEGGVQADDFFSSLELQSSSKTSNVISLSFSNKLAGGIVTRSRSFSSSLHENSKARGKVIFGAELKDRPQKTIRKKTDKIKLCPNQKVKTKGKSRKRQDCKQTPSSGKDKIPTQVDLKKPFSNKGTENVSEKSFGAERNKDDDDDWILFNNLSYKKDPYENKHILASDIQNPVRRCTPELFSMNSLLMSDSLSEAEDEVDNLLEVEDYEDNFLEEMDEFNYAPPRSHTGGKWKPGSLTVGTSPVLWQSQNWDSYLEDRQQDDDRTNRAETPIDYPAESLNKFSTGGKVKSQVPPSFHMGGKWKPLDLANRSKKFDRDSLSPIESDSNWKYEGEPPPTHTGGKWKPTPIHGTEFWKPGVTPKLELEVPPSGHATGKWGSEAAKSAANRSTLDVLAKCQSASGKCLKTSGGTIQYYCTPCNRRLSSKKMYKKHIQSELHFKRVLQENELEFDSRSLKLFHGLFTQVSYKERGLGKRAIRKPEMFKDSCTKKLKREKKIPTLVKMRGERVARRETIRCEVCRVKVPSHQFGKHLVSYCHSRRIQLTDPEQRELILNNIHAIVRQAPYQCGMCKFYCNTHASFKQHWSLPVHKEMEQSKNRRFWCALCSFECETSRSMELHLDSNSHREVIFSVNNSIPIIIRHKVVFNCGICFKEFRFNREFIDHNKIFHETAPIDKDDKFVCTVCQQNCKSIKSLQRHILNSHKGDAKIPYFCSTCSEVFNTAAEAKSHRNGQFHKYRKTLNERANSNLGLSRRCSYCEETLENLQKLKSHLLERHFEFLPKCSKCGMVFALSQEVSQHAKNNECDFEQKKIYHSSSESFPCESCPFIASVRSELMLHSTLHRKNSASEKKISCPLCGSLFTQTSLGIHLRTHLKERTYQCSTCAKTFVRRDRFARHLRLKHGNKEKFQFPNPSQKETNGEKEERKEEKDKIEPGAHVERTTESPGLGINESSVEKRQICGDAKCRYVAKDLKDSENHRIFHIGPKVYQCPQCPYSAKTNTIIKRHYMIHVDERSFPCHLCSFKARLKSHLKRHMRLHTGAKPYKCPHCSYTCNILENLRKHVLYTKIHPGKKLYECKLCSFSTNVSKEFKMHLFKNHKDDCRLSESNEVAGIYSREEDRVNSTCSISVKPRKVTQQQRKVYSAALKEKVDLLTQKFTPIVPKPQCTKKETSCPILNIKKSRNSVEDKRKILRMELEKLKNQIKPSNNKLPRSYPSPAEKLLKIRGTAEEDADAGGMQVRKIPKEGGLSVPDVLHRPSDLGGGLLLVNLTPSGAVVPEDSISRPSKCEGSLRPTDFSPTCILYENVLPSDEMELYLLKDYQV